MMLKAKGQKIDKYTIAFPIKTGAYAETYRVKDTSGKNYFLKLINLSKLNHSQFCDDNSIWELKVCECLHHPNLLHLHETRECVINGRRMLALVYDFISGETLAQYFCRANEVPVHEATQILKGVLKGLAYLHSQKDPILHNELTLNNVMLDLSTNPPTPKIIDFGHARFLSQPSGAFPTDIDSYYYRASEAFHNVCTAQSDIYSAGAIFYTLIFGAPPYFDECANDENLKDSLLAARETPLHVPTEGIFELTPTIAHTIATALSNDVDERFASANDMLAALDAPPSSKSAHTSKQSTQPKQATQTKSSPSETRVKKGNGFSDVAGMQDLKDQLQSDVIDVLQNPERANELGISVPNGLLFYGPPGCGKTYFAEKFAEEIGCTYMYVKCSDIASPYIHGGQSKIAALFDEAREKSPTILFLDEIEAMLMDRNLHNNVSESGEVNEFLTQLNNCGQAGVLVIGATNKPDTIDPAALRAGRFDYKYYIPNPDKETRAKIFEVILSHRQTDFGIEYDKLADMTEHYVSADIRLVIDKAARLTFKRKLKKITMATLLEVLENSKPSISEDVLKEHEDIRDRFNGVKQERNPIGFI